MSKRYRNKLSLSTETLRTLAGSDLDRAVGGDQREPGGGFGEPKKIDQKRSAACVTTATDRTSGPSEPPSCRPSCGIVCF